MRETEHENEQTTERVIQDRQYQIDGAGSTVISPACPISRSVTVDSMHSNVVSGHRAYHESAQDVDSFVADNRAISAGVW
jgi:hypothetical protein